MVYYVRLLKPPTISTTKGEAPKTVVKTLVTITTDLGDAFFPGSVQLMAVGSFERPGRSRRMYNPTQRSTWEPGMRALPIEISVSNDYATSLGHIRIYCSLEKQGDLLHVANIPEIVGLSSEIYNGSSDQITARMVKRSFKLYPGGPLNIWEETGESIARHLW